MPCCRPQQSRFCCAKTIHSYMSYDKCCIYQVRGLHDVVNSLIWALVALVKHQSSKCAAGMEEVPEWLMFDEQDVHDTLVATSKHKPHLIADMAAMANVPGLANGHVRRPVVLQTQQHASQVSPIFLAPKYSSTLFHPKGSHMPDFAVLTVVGHKSNLIRLYIHCKVSVWVQSLLDLLGSRSDQAEACLRSCRNALKHCFNV